MRIFLCFLLFLICIHSEDWPCWRGANGDGIAKVSDHPITWPVQGPKEKWRIPLGTGYSCLSVYKNVIYTLFGDDEFEYCIALNAKDGSEIWRKKIGYLFRQGSEGGPQSTPTVHEDKVYVLSGYGDLWCLNIKNGRSVWNYNIINKFGSEVQLWGTCSSLLIYKDKLYFHVANHAIVAISKNDGKIVWESGQESSSYSTPIIVKDKQPQVIFLTGSSCIGISPDNGHTLWRYPLEREIESNASAPIYHKNFVFFCADSHRGSTLLKLEPQQGYQVQKVWKSKVRNRFSSSILWKGHLYGCGGQFLVCVDFTTGKIKWKKRGFHNGMITGLSNGDAIVLGEKGNLSLIELNSKKYINKGTCFPFPGSRCRATPTVVDDSIFLRNREEIICLNLRDDS
ncbi:PQQ-binding-like beta-propeller repeat protein [Candidatus Uabimicrobium sp. HlEnr_7]|uniref:PQQ-binding-like beta-propeller repeat protein n=1 Tax=Candidatus Uabimicrobium helgolandensis TaxID=3095367 RepID=UPI0035568DA7